MQHTPRKLTKIEQADCHFSYGKRCIEDAKYLYDKDGNMSSFAILLIHGIELLLKSYIIFKVKDNNGTSSFLKSLGHDYLKIYRKCNTLGNDLNNPELNTTLELMSNLFFPNSVDVRYIEESRMVSFPVDSFKTIESTLISPLEKLIKSLSL